MAPERKTIAQILRCSEDQAAAFARRRHTSATATATHAVPASSNPPAGDHRQVIRRRFQPVPATPVNESIGVTAGLRGFSRQMCLTPAPAG